MPESLLHTSWLSSPPPGYKVFNSEGDFVYIHETVKIFCPLHIERFSYINSSCIFGGKYPVHIGAFCSIAAECYFWTYETHTLNHAATSPLRTILGVDIEYPEIIEKPEGITIGNDVYIGHQARIMPGVKIGNGAVVGARAVVTRDLEPYGIYGGVPARLIRKRFSDEVIVALENIKFWEWPLEKIHRNQDFFNLNLTQIDSADAIYKVLVDV